MLTLVAGDGTTNGTFTKAMLPARSEDIVVLPKAAAPRLLVIVDAEEEFDWDKPFSPENYSVTAMAAQGRANRIFEEYSIVPTYAVDYPVASQEAGFRPLVELLHSQACEIGAQLHPWVTPPHDEEICERNSFTSNLPVSLQRRKLETLTRSIRDSFGIAPRLYRAGRYGAGEATPAMLSEFGYEIDCSVLPGRPLSALAPSFEGATAHPYWLGSARSILELPVTVGEAGVGRRLNKSLYSRLTSPNGRRFKFPAIAARLGIFERIRLTPEGRSLEDCKRLTRAMLQDGYRIFVVSYHSPSLVPGHTPYVRNQADLERFFGWLKGYFDFFFGRIGGRPATPSAVRNWALQQGDNTVSPSGDGLASCISNPL